MLDCRNWYSYYFVYYREMLHVIDVRTSIIGTTSRVCFIHPRDLTTASVLVESDYQAFDVISSSVQVRRYIVVSPAHSCNHVTF